MKDMHVFALAVIFHYLVSLGNVAYIYAKFKTRSFFLTITVASTLCQSSEHFPLEKCYMLLLCSQGLLLVLLYILIKSKCF